MRERGIFTYLATRVAGNTAPRIGGVDELGELPVGHAGLRRFVSSFVDGESNAVGKLHQGKFGGGFDAATAEGDWSGAGCCECGAGAGDAVGEDELSTLFDADPAGGDAGFLQGFGEELVGIFVFVPGEDAGR